MARSRNRPHHASDHGDASRKRKPSSRPRPSSDSSDDDFQIDADELEEEDDHDDPLVPEECDLEPASAPRRKKRKHKARRKKKRKTAARRSRPRNRQADTSDEDFEIDDGESSLDGEDVEELEALGAVTRSSKRARYSNSGARQVISGNAFGESTFQSAKNIWGENEFIVEATQSRSTSGRCSHSDMGSEKDLEKLKGKQIAVEADTTETKREESAAVCGVCLSEEVVERGKLDCCDHFFCFTCIMEWAKVESRCPMCKQRFVTIVRPSNSGSKRTRTVRIPLRDQVYVPPDEEVEEDPYSEIVCMECLEAGEEGLLLLCDHCDSAAHTYCVGLGRSVPRGDWFCRSCQTTMPESSGGEDEEEELVLGFSDDDEDEVSIIRVVVATLETGRSRRARQTTVERSSRSMSRALPAATRTRPRSGSSRRRLLGRLSGPGPGARRQLPQAPRTMTSNTESAGHQDPPTSNRQAGPARTVPQQRRLQERIQTMRDTWGRIQRGDLQFTAIGSCSVDPYQAVGGANNVSKVEPRSSTELASTEEKQKHVDSEIEQAWHMMEKAKSLSVGTSSVGAQQKLGASWEGTCLPAKTGTRPAAGFTMNSNAGSTCRASSSNFHSGNSPHVRIKPAVLLNNRNDYGNSIRKDSLVSTCPEIVSKTDGVRRNFFEEAGGKEQSNKKSNIKDFFGDSGSLGPTLMANSSVHIKQQVPLCAVSSSAIRANETVLGSILKCPSEAPETVLQHKLETLGKKHDEIVNHEKQTVINWDAETGKLDPHGKEYGSIQDSGHGAHILPLPLHTSDKRLKELLANEGKRDGRNFYHDKTVDSIHATVSSDASAGQKNSSECVKGEVAAKVKTELWPLYLSEGFDKVHFKKIARCAVHMLLDAHFSENGKSNPNQLHCAHAELQEKSLLAGCCDDCLKLEVRKVIRTAKTKIETA